MTVASESVLFNTVYPKLEKHIHPLKLLEELEKVDQAGVDVDWDCGCLDAAMCWMDTPQDDGFWYDLYAESNGH